MRSIERRFRIESERNPELSSLVNFGRAVEAQAFNRESIVRWFGQLVDPSDYEKRDRVDILEHMMKLSHGKKQAEDTENQG